MEYTFKEKKEPSTRERAKCRKKFLHYFPKGFTGKKYQEWERDYKLQAHEKFQETLNKNNFKGLLKEKKFIEIAQTAIRIESRTNLLFSFEKMALRDAVKSEFGAKLFAEGLYEYVYGAGSLESRFNDFVKVIAELPRIQTRVLTWPVVTVFGFLGNPDEHLFLKPTVTKIAAKKYDYNFVYASKPNWKTYESALGFARLIGNEIADLKPKDMIDLQSFIWVLGSEEYPD